LREDVLRKLYSNPNHLDYLRRHPKWYQFLEDRPDEYKEFEKVVKSELKQTPYDKIERIKKQLNFASSLINYLQK